MSLNKKNRWLHISRWFIPSPRTLTGLALPKYTARALFTNGLDHFLRGRRKHSPPRAQADHADPRAFFIWLLCSAAAILLAVRFFILAQGSDGGWFQSTHYGMAATATALLGSHWGLRTLCDYKRYRRGIQRGRRKRKR